MHTSTALHEFNLRTALVSRKYIVGYERRCIITSEITISVSFLINYLCQSIMYTTESWQVMNIGSKNMKAMGAFALLL